MSKKSERGVFMGHGFWSRKFAVDSPSNMRRAGASGIKIKVDFASTVVIWESVKVRAAKSVINFIYMHSYLECAC